MGRVRVSAYGLSGQPRLYDVDPDATPGAVVGDNLTLGAAVTLLSGVTLPAGYVLQASDLLNGLMGGTGTSIPSGTDWSLITSIPANVQAVAGLSAVGMVVRQAAGTWTTRGLVQPAAGITISNANGDAGAPTFALADDLAAVEGLATTGLAVRTAANTWATRTITAGAGMVVTNGDGVAGDPTTAHADTSSVADLNSNNSNGVVIQGYAVTFDTFGHVQTVSVGTVDLDTRYLQATSIGNGLKIVSNVLSAGESGTEDTTTFLRGDGIWSNVLTGGITAYGARNRFAANSEVFALQIGYNSTRVLAGEAFYIGATNSSTPDLVLSRSDGTERVRVLNNGNIGLNNASEFGSGSGVIGVANATVVPTTNPTGGAVWYVESGASKARGSSGTTTTFAAANPHCPACGSDFVHEWDNPERWGYLAMCMNCFADGVNSHTRTRGAWNLKE